MSNTEIDIQKMIRNFIKSNFLLNSASIVFSNDDSFIEKGIIDSTGVLEMVQFIQNSYDIIFNDDEIIPENLDTINNITAFIRRKKEIAS